MSLPRPPLSSLTDKPRMVSLSQNVTVTDGDTLDLICLAEANPSPTYHWTHNNVTVEDENNTTLIIEAIHYDKGGVYRCIARNIRGEGSVEMRVDVVCELNVFFFTFLSVCIKAKTLPLDISK